MTRDAASEDYDLLHACDGFGVAHSNRPDGCEGYTGRGHLFVQTRGGAGVDLDRALPLLHRVRCTVDLEFLGPVSDDHLHHLTGLANLLSLKIYCGAVTDAGLRHLTGLAGLRVLDLSRQAVTDAGAAHLARLAGLRALTLRGTRVGDGGLAVLAGLTGLTKLDLGGCPVTGRGVEALAGLAGLRELSLQGTRVGDAGLAALAGLTNLTRLDLSDTGVGDDGLAAVGRAVSLENLSLDNLPVTDRGGAALSGLVRLRSLSLRATRVGGDGAAWLAGLTRLDWLTLGGTAVTDDALRHLTGCGGLTGIRLDGAAVTGRGLARLPAGLRHLSLTGVRLQGDDLAALGRLRSLDSLVVGADAVSDEVAEALDRLHLGRRPAWDEGVAAFERLPSCPLCRGVIRDNEPVFCTRPYTPPEGDLFDYARVPIHWGCYAGWEHRPRFARGYFEAQAGWLGHNQFWGVARKDEDVLVSVNPARYVGEADVILAATGSSIRIPLADWEEWVSGGWFDGCAHPAERDAVGEVIPSLRANLPTAEALVSAAGMARAAGPPAARPEGMVDRISCEIACQKLAARAAEKGLNCPHCGHFGDDFRYERVGTVSAEGAQSHLACPACNGEFGPDDI